MDCCHCQGIETKFDQKYVTRKLRQYQKDGPKKTTLQLIKALQTGGVEQMDLMDIGGGVGDIQHALLACGVSKAINIEASTAYIEACKLEAERKGHASRIDHHIGDFVALAEGIPSADIVTLDRVICCYPDMTQLVSLSTQKARRLYGVVYPRDTWWVKLGTLLYYNLRHWLKGISMRNYVHPTEAVEDVIQQNGFKRRFYHEMGPWQIVVFSRT